MPQYRFSRTDMAIEAADTGDEMLPEGVFVSEKHMEDITAVTVKIETDGAARRLGRPKGEYITLEGDFTREETLTLLLKKSLQRFLPDGAVLVICLGNRGITPDALGPMAAERIIATRHLSGELRRSLGLEALRDVCVIAPGVMGQTGLEASEIANAVAASTGFSAAVVIDALASRSGSRLCRSIQLSNTGISPGSGVQNSRKELSEATLGIPVISVGVPTVVDAMSLIEHFCPDCECDEAAFSMMVTPRQIDSMVRQGADIISRAVNEALHPKIAPEILSALS